MSELTLVLPPEWATGEVLLASPIAQSVDGAVLMSFFLTDGSSILGLAWKGGQAVARSSHVTGWAIEEQHVGQMPRAAGGTVERMWTVAIEALIEAKQMAEAEFGGLPGRDPR